MSKLVVVGPKKLEGEISVYGSKNSVLSIIAATVLNGGNNTIKNCPDISDVHYSFEILKKIGCRVTYNKKEKIAVIDSSYMNDFCVNEKLMREMRSSIIFLGSIISRCKKAVVSYPGGCELGPRPIDLHLKAFKQLGVDIEESHGYIKCSIDKVKSQTINLSFPSVGATINIILLSVIGNSEINILNAAKEPEIVDLQNYLNKMGAKINGAGSETITITGVKKLTDVEHEIIPDRIVASTYLSAVASCTGNIKIKHVDPLHIQSFSSILIDSGAILKQNKDSIEIKVEKKLNSVNVIKTMPYPGFATDSQSIAMSAFAKANGTSVFVENMFESRFKHVEELTRMGADITVDGRVAVVRGVSNMFGANVKATDLRGGAALVIAALGANGRTEISEINHIDRGYEAIEKEFSSLGADIVRIQ